MPQPAGRARRAPAVADLPDDLPRRLRARGGRRAGLRRVDRASSSATTTGRVARAAAARGRAWARAVSSRSRAASGRSPRSSCCSRWASSARSAELLDQLGVERDARTNVARDDAYMTTVPGVFVAGDAGRGQSLIVWAIAEGRSAAHEVDAWLIGQAVAAAAPDQPDGPPAPRLTAAGSSAAGPNCGPRLGGSGSTVRLGTMRRAKIVCTLGPADQLGRAAPRARPSRHGRRPAQPSATATTPTTSGSTSDVRKASDADRPRGRHPRRPAGSEDPHSARFANGPIQLVPGRPFTITTDDVPGDEKRGRHDVHRPARATSRPATASSSTTARWP